VSDGEGGRVVERRVLWKATPDQTWYSLHGEGDEALPVGWRIVAERVEPEKPKERWHVLADYTLDRCAFPSYAECPISTTPPKDLFTGAREAAEEFVRKNTPDESKQVVCGTCRTDHSAFTCVPVPPPKSRAEELAAYLEWLACLSKGEESSPAAMGYWGYHAERLRRAAALLRGEP
jgi:hypothetical protein